MIKKSIRVSWRETYEKREMHNKLLMHCSLTVKLDNIGAQPHSLEGGKGGNLISTQINGDGNITLRLPPPQSVKISYPKFGASTVRSNKLHAKC